MAKLSSDGSYVIVEKGDTLSEIELKYLPKYYNGGKTLGGYNNISNINLIYVGQKIYLSNQKAPAKNNTNRAKIEHFGLQSKPSEGYTNRTLFATWTWDKSNTENYQVKWEYDTGDGVWFLDSESTVTTKHCVHSAPQHANKVRFKVKPISKTRTVNGKESKYWTASWSTVKTYSFANNPPSIPGKPTVTVESLKLTAKVDASDLGASMIQFKLWKDGKETSTKGKASVGKLGEASYEFKVAAGSVYQVTCRSYGNGEYSDWSDPSEEKGTIPPTPKGFSKCLLQGEKDNYEVVLEWKSVATATSYEIEYTTDRSNFDKTDEPKKKDVGNVLTWKFLKDVIEDGKTYYFRIRAKNANGESGWSTDSAANTNDIPEAPTTWSSSNSVVLGDPLTLYWVHNSTDGNSETKARLRISVGNTPDSVVQQDIIEIPKSTDEKEKLKTSKYDVPMIVKYKVEPFLGVDTGVENEDVIFVVTKEVVSDSINGSVVEGAVTNDGRSVYMYMDGDGEPAYYCVQSIYHDGAVLIWEVQTMGGVVNKSVIGDVIDQVTGNDSAEAASYSKWSTPRTIYIYARPTMDVSMCNVSGEAISDETLDALPFVVKSIPGDFVNQAPVSFHILISAASSYVTVDDIGVEKQIVAGEAIYSKYIDVVENNSDYVLEEKISAGDIVLENGESYTVTVTMGMNSGLTAEETMSFTVGWNDEDNLPEPNAEIIIDEDDYSASIRPYCETFDGTLVEGVTLAVYRREFNGKFTEISSGLSNSENKFVLDPHPSLDYARYRIVATYETTGAVTYTDLPGIPVACNAAVIQWDETWSSFDVPAVVGAVAGSAVGVLNDGAFSDQPRSGSMLKIPYNIDISDKTKIDVEMVEYIGREHPVSYYGTQLGESSTWNMVIPKSDKETLYALRRLSVYRGDVYVREPSGTGYWANVDVSFPLKHKDVTVPITMNVTRVEGGI